MAVRGVKPQPPALKVVRGNPGKRPIPPAEPQVEPREKPLVCHKKLTKVQQSLWDQFIEPSWWLTETDIPKAYMWVCLQSQHDRKPSDMNAAMIGQLRALGSELGFDPASRQRISGPSGKSKDPAERFFS